MVKAEQPTELIEVRRFFLVCYRKAKMGQSMLVTHVNQV
jgi:hypothetical protein